MWKEFLTAYFSFTKKERTGIIVLVTAIILISVLPFLYPLFISHPKQDSTQFEKDIATLRVQQQDSDHRNNYSHYNNSYPAENKYVDETPDRFDKGKGSLFYFDPNTATPVDWQRLGLRDKTIATIQNYLSKGGHFYKPEDLGKIWGLHPDEVQRLIPYVQIAPVNSPVPETSSFNASANYSNTHHMPAMVDINLADTSAYIALPGIGSKLAQRIINFRDKLGGFYSVAQVGETYGLPDSTFQKIKPFLQAGSATVKQIDINTASLEELKAHPYIRYNIASAIINYRNQHGKFSSVEDVKKIMLITDEVYNKVNAYLKIN
ncbi:MAG: helix-hairpin-helix domain-containing protein [Bacteroidetes bacterium]|nr:helix-hairpin-helix domain-containing protein [Bacteroidota bacterium]